MNNLLQGEKTLAEAQVHPLQMKVQKLTTQLAENQRQFDELDQVYSGQLDQAKDERDLAKREVNELQLRLKTLDQKYSKLQDAFSAIQVKETNLESLNQELQDAIEEDRFASKEELSRMKKATDMKAGQFETQMFMIRNRLIVLAQYLRVKLDSQEIMPEDIIKAVLQKIKEDNHSQNVRYASRSRSLEKRRLEK